MIVRAQLKGVVAVWLTNGNQPVDGANDTRYEMYSGGWTDAYSATEDLVNEGLLKWADEDAQAKHDREGGTYAMVVPTAQGIFEALS